jgi:hypothetical protein
MIHAIYDLIIIKRPRDSWSPVQGVIPTFCQINNFRIDYEWDQANEPTSSRWRKKTFHKLIDFIDTIQIYLRIYSFILRFCFREIHLGTVIWRSSYRNNQDWFISFQGQLEVIMYVIIKLFSSESILLSWSSVQQTQKNTKLVRHLRLNPGVWVWEDVSCWIRSILPTNLMSIYVYRPK